MRFRILFNCLEEIKTNKIFGGRYDNIKNQIIDIIEGNTPSIVLDEPKVNVDPTPFHREKKAPSISIPLSDKLLPLEKVPDEVFSQKLIGDGFAIDPTDGLVV